MLKDFLTANREEIVARTRAKVACRPSPTATEDELKHGVPLFLGQLIETLTVPQSAENTGKAIGKSAAIHGGKLLQMGFTVAQVVYDYGDICQAVTELAEERGARITTSEFHTLNRCLDDAIAEAVTEYTSLRDRTMVRGTEHLGELAREMRSTLSASLLSYDLMRRGRVGIEGSTSAALGRNLFGLRSLLDDALARARLESGARDPERVEVTALLAQIAGEVSVDANIRAVKLVVATPEGAVEVSADRQLLEVAVSKLIQNAVRVSRRLGQASVRTRATSEQVTIEIQDEGGGLPAADAEIFTRAIDPRRADRSAPGQHLSIVRECVEAIGGAVRVRSTPDVGCVFTIELRRLPAA
jgi:signal transduction histidine kinase